MPKKISVNEMRQWLEMYDAGKSEASIAREAHRDTRTVKSCIKKVRQERRVNAAQIELLKNALKKHQDSLLGLVNDLSDRIVIPDLNITFSNHEEPVSFEIEDEVKWELLKEHLKGDPLWTNLINWEKAVSKHISARVALEMKCAEMLKMQLGLPEADESVSEPFGYSSRLLELLYQTTVKRIMGRDEKTKPEELITVDRQGGGIKYGSGTMLVWVQDKKEERRKKIINTFREIMEESGIASFKNSYQEAEEAAHKARRSLEEISLLGFVSGECRVCSRLVK